MGAPAACPENEFIELFETLGAAGTAKKLGIKIRRVFSRRKVIENKIGRQLTIPSEVKGGPRTRHNISHPPRITCDVQEGIVLIGSDGHYWPGPATTAHRAFVKFARDLRPKIIVMNGDAFDGARISRHPPIGWEKRPEVIQELEAVQERLGEIEQAAPRRARLIWPLGNHDQRFETRLAVTAAEYARVHGFHLKDHVGPRWEPCWAVWINDVVVKHRFRNGVHSRYNNSLHAGKTMVTGHTHALGVTPMPDYNGVRYGVETGCLADPNGAQFVDYTEDNPKRWEAGFAVLTFHRGRLLPPEIVTVWDDSTVVFRGQLIKV